MLPAYQIDFQAVASGKMIASSKRKVRWRFGFPNQQAMAAGRTGVECRGEEHDIVIIWSVASGKRQVYMDGTEIHFSSSRAPIFNYSWSARGNHVIKVVAHASPPMSPTPGFRQYDLFIDGQSFFTMPKPYELNIRGQMPSNGMARGSYGRGIDYSGVPPPSSREQEEADLQKAISASLQESRQYLAKKEDKSVTSAPPAPAAVDLMDFGGAPADSQTMVSYNTPQPSYGAQSYPQYASQPPASPYQPSQGYQYAQQQQQQPAYQSPPTSSNALVPAGAPSNQYGAPPQTQSHYAAPPSQAPPMYAAAPPPAPPAYGSPAPPAYGSPAPPAYGSPVPPAYGSPAPPASVPTGNLFAPPPADPFAPAAPPAGDPYGFSQPVPPGDDPFAPRPPPPPTRDDITNSILSAYGSQQQGSQPQQQGQSHQPGQQMTTMNGNSPNNGMAPNGGGFSGGYDAAPPPEKQLSDFEKAMKRLVNVDRIDEPVEQEYRLTMKKEEQKKTKGGRSKGVAPAATGLVGSNATLSQIKEVKPNTPKTGEGVMRPPPQLFHPDAVHAGALVVHGQGPPPIQRGFGVGYGAPPPNFRGW